MINLIFDLFFLTVFPKIPCETLRCRISHNERRLERKQIYEQISSSGGSFMDLSTKQLLIAMRSLTGNHGIFGFG